ncbi:uncharacterized protein [Asterias amurensis]|uniref:uncharacterized protein n=1 Tax=Asterias amurensis TaxID=7602 RepID=UPI003AB432E1
MRPMCALSEFSKCNSLSSHDVECSQHVFNSCFLVDNNVSGVTNFALCKQHHNFLWKYRFYSKCAGCHISFQSTSKKYLCSSLDVGLSVATDILKSVHGDTALILDGYICYACYSLVSGQVSKVISLHNMKTSFQSKLSMEITEETNAIDHCLYQVYIHVIDSALEHRAVLLSDLFELYQNAIQSCLSVQKDLDVEFCSRTARWLLTCIMSTFSNSITIHRLESRKQSTLLVHCNIDLKKALHQALAKSRSDRLKFEAGLNTDSPTSSTHTAESSETLVSSLKTVLPNLNERLTSQSGKITEYYKHNPLNVVNFRYEEMLKMLDPVIFNLVSYLTFNNQEKKQVSDFPLDSYMLSDLPGSNARRQMRRRINIILCMHFVLSDSNNYPLHIIIANCVRLSHSSKLLQLLNHAGMCVSRDTLDRFLEEVKEQKLTRTDFSNISKSSFTIISVDNIDVLASYAAVTSKDAPRSWHGTSIMSQQTKPSENLSALEKLSTDFEYKVINIFGDGACLYRCIAVFSDNKLINCHRSLHGLPLDPVSLEREVQLSALIRKGTCDILREHIDVLRSLPDVVQKYLLEIDQNNSYPTFSDRIKDNEKLSTYAGHLELCAISYALSIEIRLYQETETGLTEVAKYPNDVSLFPNTNHICLLYTPSVVSLCGHFQLLIKDSCRSRLNNLFSEESIATGSVFSHFPRGAQLSLLNYVNIGSDAVAISTDDHATNTGHSSADPVKDDQVTLHPKVEGTQSLRKPRVRRKVEQEFSELVVPKPSDLGVPVFKTYIFSQLSFDKFGLSSLEENEVLNLDQEMFSYIVQRYPSLTGKSQLSIPGFKCKLSLKSQPRCEQSKFNYLYVLNEKADSAETLKKMLGLLYKSYGVGTLINHLVIAGDGATVKLLSEIKIEYGTSLAWVIPYLGDWHVLKNFQEVIMKIYWDAGLKEVAKINHKQGTLQRLQSCASFKMTHRFFMQVYESIYAYQLQVFMEHRINNHDTSMCTLSNDDIVSALCIFISDLKDCESDCTSFVEADHNVTTSLIMPFMADFEIFYSEMCEKFETFRFWHRFLREDCFSYIQLFVSIRSGNWNGRMAALKSIGQLFHAFDRQNYSRLIP